MVASETINAWRREIEAEVAEAREQLLQAELEAELATAAAPRIAASHQAISKAAVDLLDQPVGPLARRMEDLSDEGRHAAAALARALGMVTSLRSRVGDLETALQQLDAIAHAFPPEAAEEREAEPAEAA